MPLNLQQPNVGSTQWNSELYTRITDTIFSVLVTFSFVQYSSFIVRPDFTSVRFWMLLFAYSVVTISRVGYHISVATKWYKNANRFLIDLWILYGYFVLLNAPGPTQFNSLQSSASQPDVGLMLLALYYVFVGYVSWDVMKKIEWPNTESSRMKITISCYFVWGGALVLRNVLSSLGQAAIEGSTWIFVAAAYVLMFVFWYNKLLSRFFRR